MAQHSDDDLRSFLVALDKAVSKVEVSDWEAGFVASNLSRASFTEAQRRVILKMIDKYADKIKW